MIAYSRCLMEDHVCSPVFRVLFTPVKNEIIQQQCITLTMGKRQSRTYYSITGLKNTVQASWWVESDGVPSNHQHVPQPLHRAYVWSIFLCALIDGLIGYCLPFGCRRYDLARSFTTLTKLLLWKSQKPHHRPDIWNLITAWTNGILTMRYRCSNDLLCYRHLNLPFNIQSKRITLPSLF